MLQARIAGLTLISLLTSASGYAASDAEDALILRGQVVNPEQKPVEGATLVLVLRHGTGEDAWQVNATSDGEGKFEFAVPPKWIEPGPFYHSRTIWCYAPGYALQTASAYKQLDQELNEPIQVQLPPAADMEFKVVDPSGKPLPGCRVEPHHWVGDIPPENIRKLTSAETDEKGIARLAAMQPSVLRRVSVMSDVYGTQRMPLDNRSGNTIATIRLQNVGAIAGRLVCDDSDAIAGVRVAVGSMGHGGLTEGSGETETTADGHFHIENVSEGALTLYVSGKNVAGYRPRLPEHVVVKAGDTTEIEVPFEPTVTVRGSVVARGSEMPVAEAFVSVSYGGRRQHEHVLTDANGTFEAYILPGEVRQQLIVVPKPFQDWVRDYDINSRFEVTAENSPFDLPPLELVESRVVEGKVVDANNQPVPEAYVTPLLKGRGLGSGRADKTGKFSVRISKEVTIEEYTVSSPTESHRKAKVISESPLILQLVGPEEAANLRVSTGPTPAEKREPEFTPPDQNTKTLIVAREALIFDGHSTNWAELAEKLEDLGAKDNAVPTVHYYLTHDAYRDEARKAEAGNWAEMLSDTTGVKVQRGGGIILNQPAERYDALNIDDQWPPGADKPVVGRVVSPEGEPIENAQVVFLAPPPPTSRNRWLQSVYLKNGQVRQELDHIVTYTDANGEFRFDFPPAGASVMALAPQGFAIASASEAKQDIKLAPWARVTATIPRDEQERLQTISLSVSVQPPEGGPTAFLSISAGDLQKQDTNFEMIAVPPGHRMMVLRILWKEDDNGSMTGNGHGESLPLTLESGTTTHLEYGPLDEKE